MTKSKPRRIVVINLAKIEHGIAHTLGGLLISVPGMLLGFRVKAS